MNPAIPTLYRKKTRVKMAIRAESLANSISLAVSDEGTGIPPESLSAIFDKFYRAPGTAAGGLGLGLAIVKNVMEAHGAKIEAMNRPEGGADFVITLPVEEQPHPPTEAAPE